MIPPANLENELNEKLNAPSMEDQKEKYGRDIEKVINDRMIVMREVVVRPSTFSRLFILSNSFLHRKSHDVSRSTNKRWSGLAWKPVKSNRTLKIWTLSPRT